MKNKSILSLIALLLLASCSSQDNTNNSTDVSTNTSSDQISTNNDSLAISSTPKKKLNKNIKTKVTKKSGRFDSKSGAS